MTIGKYDLIKPEAARKRAFKLLGEMAEGHRQGLASTILTKCDPHWGSYVHPTQNRTISVREAARLQGFPDHFRFAGGSISKHYEQVGNAVPVPVARALGSAAAAHLESAAAVNAATSADSHATDLGKAA